MIIEQGNLGGSGGYARGQLESVRKGTATYALMMDDDVVCEPEGIIRAITFGDLARRPTIVGGHMFSLYSRSRLHSFGEIVQPWRFWWMTPLDGYSRLGLRRAQPALARWLHKRVDVDFNGWFMCLIPRVVLEEIGLSLPLFIKWDDSEFGLRAKQAGYPTVTFPGAAVWHVPWTDKNDARRLAGLLPPPQPLRRGAAALAVPAAAAGWSARASTTRSSTSSRCSTPPPRSGTRRWWTCSPARTSCTRSCRPSWRDQRVPQAVHRRPAHADPDAFPPVRRKKPPRKGKAEHRDPGPALAADHRRAGADPAAAADPRSCRRSSPRPSSPRWTPSGTAWRRYDSAIVSMNDGSSAALYQRDPAHYRDLLKRTVEIHARSAGSGRGWPRSTARRSPRSPRRRRGRRPSAPGRRCGSER